MILLPASSTCRRRPLLWLAALALALLLFGPARAQDATSIAQARDALEAARSTRAVRVLAAPELDAAERALEHALAAQDAGQAEGEVSHLAYLAERRAAIARMRAEERRIAQALASLSETHALLAAARALAAAAAKQRALELAKRLKRFEAREDRDGLVLTPREPWFDTGVMPARHAARAIAEAARLLGELPERQVVVLGYAMRGAPSGTAPAQLPARYQEGATSKTVADWDDLGCVRADVVRAFLISNGVDPRRISATCIAPQDVLEASAQPVGLPAGEAAIAIMPENGSGPAPTNENPGPASAAQ
jgi:outer membrane protein OmpA-like peptidoglycan-associated protein